MNTEIIWIGAIASFSAGMATGAGAVPILFAKKVSDKLLDVMLGFSAGVMLAATSFSLIVPAIDLGSVWIAASGIVLGALVLHLIDRFVLICILPWVWRGDLHGLHGCGFSF